VFTPREEIFRQSELEGDDGKELEAEEIADEKEEEEVDEVVDDGVMIFVGGEVEDEQVEDVTEVVVGVQGSELE